MPLGIGMRSIWVALRAVNYSRPAFDQATSQVKALKAWQEKLIKHQQQVYQQSRMMIGVGLMYVAMGAMVAFAIQKMIAMSVAGSQYMDRFNQIAGKAAANIGTQLLKTLKPVLDILTGFMKLVAENKALARFIANMMVMATVFLLLNGTMKLVTGAMKLMGLQSVYTGIQLKITAQGVQIANLSFKSLIATLNMALFLFTIIYSIADMLYEAFGHNLPATIAALIPIVIALGVAMWFVAGAVAVITVGVAAVAAGVALWSLQRQISGMTPNYQSGTRFIQRTTPAVVHAGEAVVRAQDVDERFGRPSTTINDVKIDLSGSTIHTKADVEELMPTIKRAIREATRAKE